MPRNKSKKDIAIVAASSSNSDSAPEEKSPKKKARKEVVVAASSSDSDSGPEDRNPTPAKKSKTSAKTAPSKANVPSDKAEWTLEKLRMVKINEFRGRKMVDIREHYEKNGEILPGKKGISLSIIQWKALMEHADEITAAVEC